MNAARHLDPESLEELGRVPRRVVPCEFPVDLQGDEAIVTGRPQCRQHLGEVKAARPERPAVGLAQVEVPHPRPMFVDRLEQRPLLNVHVDGVEHISQRGRAHAADQRGGLGRGVVEADL